MPGRTGSERSDHPLTRGRSARSAERDSDRGAAEIALATLVLIEGRFADAERLYVEATARMESAGSVHTGFVRLALAAIWLNDDTLGDHLDDVRALHEALGPMVADLLALALHTAGRGDEARMSPGPIRPDFFFTFLTSLRAMAIVALNDRDAAEEIYADLLPHREGPGRRGEPVAGAASGRPHTQRTRPRHHVPPPQER